MGDPAPTTDRMHRHKHRHEPHKQNTRAISHQPSPIGRKPPYICPPTKDPAKIRIREATIRSLNCTVDRTVSFQTYDSLKRSLQSTAVIALPATLPPKGRERKKRTRFTVSLSCRRPYVPGTSLHLRRNQRPSTIIPNLIEPEAKRPFPTLA